MGKRPFLFLLSLALFLACLLASSPARAMEKRNVLYLNSYHHGYLWSDSILRGIEALFKERQDYLIDLQVEYLDSKKYYGPDQTAMLFEHYRHKFAWTRFDAVIVSDDNAYNFILQYGRELFPGLPVVFCGVNDYRPEDAAGRREITGVLENPDFEATIRTALSLHPDKKRMMVIGDQSLTGTAIQNQLRAVAPLFAGRLDFTFVDDLSLDGIMAFLPTLPEDAMLFMVPIYLDARQQFYSADEVLSLISGRVDIPVYSAWAFLLGHGIVGGRLHDGVSEGRLAAQMVLRILSGEAPSDIPIVRSFDDPYMFDYNMLKRFGISENRLPPDSQLINEPYNFYTINKQLFWTIIGSFAVLLFVLMLLVTNHLQKRVMEKELREAEEKYRGIFENSALGIFRLTPQGVFVDANRAVMEMFGYDGLPDFQALGPSLARELMAGKSASRIQERPARPGERIARLETHLAHKDGQGIIANLNVRTAPDGSLEGVVEDITQRKQAERALRQSRRMLGLVLDTIPLLVYWKDRDLRYMGVNRAFLDVFGFTSHEEVIGRPDTDILARPDYASRAARADRQVLDSDAPLVRMEWEFEDLLGQNRVLQITKVPLHDDQGQVVGVLSTAEDVTERASLERQLLQSQKMEAIGTLAGGIAHDFNNILTSIINSVELALLDAREDVLVQDLNRALKAGQRGSRLVKQILAFSRPSRAGFQTVRPAEAVREALALIRASLPKNILVVEDIAADADCCCRADPTQLNQIVMNLCTNAFHAMREQGGTLEVSLAGTRLDQDRAESMNLPPGDYLRLTIADDGPGIPPDILDKIFDPFFTTKGKAEGTGLGLAVVLGIVKNHGGGLQVTSLPFERTVFDVYLPRTPSETVGAVECAPLPQGRGRILLVEDDEDQLDTLPRVLATLGYQATALARADEALEELTRNPDGYDLVLTDYDMPGINGIELAHRLEALAPGLPVVLVSGRLGAVQACPSGGNILTVLHKPYGQAALAQAIRMALRPARQEEA